jgi:transcriptional regulator GlxA family with amidase domain
LTSAGTAASIDLSLHIVRLDFGAEIANAVARTMVVPPHRDGGQAQYVDHPIDSRDGSELFGETLAWAEANIADPITIDDLARRSAMSPRTFARRFSETNGTTPHQWLTHQRVQLAQRLLESTNHSVEYIATAAGLGTATNLRLHFQRIVKTTPTQYRRTFCCLESA